MDRQHILDEIKRTTKENGGVPLGTARFFAETGIRVSDWRGKCWARWGDAVREAGFAPNQMNQPYGQELLIQTLIGLVQELGRFRAVGTSDEGPQRRGISLVQRVRSPGVDET
jgi:hypothetical protein